MRDHVIKKDPVLFAVSGYKKTGKTTLILELIRILTGQGYKVATIKHDGHDFTPDVPGTDTFRHREAGAYGTAIFSSKRVMIAREAENVRVQDLKKVFPEADIILLEGFRNSEYPKYNCNYPSEVPDAEKIAGEIIKLVSDYNEKLEGAADETDRKIYKG